MRFLLILFVLGVCIGGSRAQSPYVLVLGTAQDGGYPQAGCKKACCRAVWEHKLPHQLVSCIAVVDPLSKQQWMFDATPDFIEQLHLLSQTTSQPQLDGIFLTHAHMGHYTGLMHLGREAMSTAKTKVYAMPRMSEFLTKNAPWSQLVGLQNIDIQIIQDEQTVVLNERLSVVPIRVPHRDEFSETVGFRILTPQRKLVFIPDIDKWQKWPQSLVELVRQHDVLLLDGTFYQDGEIARPMAEVPHPFVEETMELLASLPEDQRRKVQFIHLNHTNPLLRPKSPQREAIRQRGFGVASQGQKVRL